MSDVARTAGVSMKSVSRVINREPNVSEKLRAKVQAAIERLGYVPDLAAQSLAGGRALAMAILFEQYDNDFISSYYPNLQAGATRACSEHRYHLLVETILPGRPDFVEVLNQILGTARVDGFILPPPYSDDTRVMDALDARGIRYARISPFDDLERAPYVAIDDRDAASEMTRHLWEIGHRRFGFVKGREGHPSADARRDGFVETLGGLGCHDFTEANGAFTFEGGIEAAAQLAAGPNPPTAIFASNDDSAAGVMAGLSQLGLKVPQDVSVAGFDDTWIARMVWPNLTTIRQPIVEMAYAAAKHIVGSNGKADPGPSTDLRTELIIRGSTAAPKNTA